jgi:hypothetical protein
MLRWIGIGLGVLTVYTFYRLATSDDRKTVATKDGAPS